MEKIFARIEDEHGRRGRETVEEAYALMKEVHHGQMRDDGTEFWTHPAAVASILVGQGYTDPELIAAALLHDAVEDTGLTLAEVKDRFGSKIEFLVHGVTDVGKADGETPIKDRYERMEQSQERILKHGERDNRVFLIKAADRIHNLRAMSAISRERQERLRAEAKKFHKRIAQQAGDDEMAEIIDDLVKNPV